MGCGNLALNLFAFCREKQNAGPQRIKKTDGLKTDHSNWSKTSSCKFTSFQFYLLGRIV